MTDDTHGTESRTDDSEDELSPRFKAAAHAYNTPPRDVPRDAMWAAIQRERTGVVGAVPVSIAPRRSTATAWRWAAAAAVLIGVGYAAGRLTPPSLPAVAAADVADRRAPSATDALAANEHFARAEAVLMQFRNDAANAQADTAVGRWARQLLTDTRLLLDSPAAENTGRRAMLQDLELILIQIARSSRSNDPEDLKLTSDALRHSGLLNKLRTVASRRTAPRT